MSKPTLKVTSDFTKDFKKIIARYKNDSVLIGIPQEEAPRDKEEEQTPINNATLLAINHFGVEEMHIPPRPVLSIGMKNAQSEIAEQFKKCVLTVLSKGQEAIDVYYERAGIIGSNACKAVINDQDSIDAPAPATLIARKYIGKNGFKGTSALLVTGQMRNAITYVVKK